MGLSTGDPHLPVSRSPCLLVSLRHWRLEAVEGGAVFVFVVATDEGEGGEDSEDGAGDHAEMTEESGGGDKRED